MMHMIQYDSLCLAVQLVFTIERDILPGPFINFYGSGVHTRGIPHYTVLYWSHGRATRNYENQLTGRRLSLIYDLISTLQFYKLYTFVINIWMLQHKMTFDFKSIIALRGKSTKC